MDDAEFVGFSRTYPFASLAGSPAGDFVVSWHTGEDPYADDDTDDEISADDYGPDSEILARHYRANGEPFGDEFVVNTTLDGNQTAPIIALNDQGDFVAIWNSYEQDGDDAGAYGRVFHGLPSGDDDITDDDVDDDLDDDADDDSDDDDSGADAGDDDDDACGCG